MPLRHVELLLHRFTTQTPPRPSCCAQSAPRYAHFAPLRTARSICAHDTELPNLSLRYTHDLHLVQLDCLCCQTPLQEKFRTEDVPLIAASQDEVGDALTPQSLVRNYALGQEWLHECPSQKRQRLEPASTTDDHKLFYCEVCDERFETSQQFALHRYVALGYGNRLIRKAARTAWVYARPRWGAQYAPPASVLARICEPFGSIS